MDLTFKSESSYFQAQNIYAYRTEALLALGWELLYHRLARFLGAVFLVSM